MKKLMILILPAMIIGGCSTMNRDIYNSQHPVTSPTTPTVPGGNTYDEIIENDFIDTQEENKSNISLSVGTAAYSDVRNQIKNNYTVDKNAVKIEEMVNYFDYDYLEPADDEPLAVTSAIIDTPWNEETKLMLVGLQTEKIEMEEVKNNIVLLVDTSGSMYGSDRLDIVIEGFSLLVDNLDEDDVVSIITYASSEKIVLDGVNGTRKQEIKNALKNLKASGATSGGSAIQKAYQLAFKHQTNENRSSIVIATDGDFNVGINNPEELKAMISENRNKGVSLSVVGVGYGNMRSNILDSIALAGGGVNAYISNMTDAKKCFVEELRGMLIIVANDAKAQLEFNSEKVAKYRLIGFENKVLTDEEWEDEETMAGALGSGCSVTAMYEIILHDDYIGTLATFALRYKDVIDNEPQSFDFTIDDSFINPSTDKVNTIGHDDQVFISAVIEVGLLLRNSQFKGTATYSNVLNRLLTINLGNDSYKMDFLQIVRKLNGENIVLE